MDALNKINVLVSSLNWGAGHASRDIPIIKVLLAKGCRVYVACTDELKPMFSGLAENVTFVRLPELNIKYNRKIPLWLKLIIQIPHFLKIIYHEHQATQRLVREYNIKAIISDNRYGVRHKSIYSIIITHQLQIEIPTTLSMFSKLVNKVNHHLISQFNKCWIPDAASPKHLTGRLSNPELLKIPFQHIGILSRFEYYPQKTERQILIMISGPEPQRTTFTNLAFKQALKTTGRVIIVAPNEPTRVVKHAVGRVEIINSPKQDLLNRLILESKYIIARAGYSTIMELVSLKKTAILVPTPGQTEQEYLAQWMIQYGFINISQNKLDINEDILKIRNCIPEKETWPTPDENKISDCIDDIISKFKNC